MHPVTPGSANHHYFKLIVIKFKVVGELLGNHSCMVASFISENTQNVEITLVGQREWDINI